MLVPVPAGKICETAEIACVTVDRIAGQPPLDGQMSEIRVKRGHTAQGPDRLLPFGEGLH